MEIRKHPFLPSLVTTPHDGIYDLEGMPDRVVKVWPIITFDGLKDIYTARNLHAKFRSQGIAIPDYDVVIVNNRIDRYQSDCAYYYVQKIYGKNPEKDTFSPTETDEIGPHLVNFNQGLIGITQDVVENGGPYLWDVALRQNIFGQIRGGATRKLYFVDTDPFIDHFDPNDNTATLPSTQRFYTNYLPRLYSNIARSERILDVRLQSVRDRFTALLNTLNPPTTVRYDMYELFSLTASHP